MSYIWDIILVAGMLCCIILSAKKGFIGACKNIVSIILTVILMSTMHPVILNGLQSSNLGNDIKKVVTENVTKTYEKEQISEETDTTDTEKSVEICKALGLPSFIEKDIEKSLVEMAQIRNNVMEVITDALSLLIMKIIALLILFIIVKLFVFLAMKILESLFSLPVLKSVNTGLGALIGIINALLIVYLICGVLNLVVPMDKMPKVQETVSSTYVLKYFYDNNLLLSLIM